MFGCWQRQHSLAWQDGGLLSSPPVLSAHPGRDVSQPLGFFPIPFFSQGKSKGWGAACSAWPWHWLDGGRGFYHPKNREEKEDRAN